MKLKDFLEIKRKDSKDYTFTIAKAVKDDYTPFYHYEYYQTPIRALWEWDNCRINDYIVINPSACPIDISGGWQNRYNKGMLENVIITREQDLFTMYSKNQAKDMLEWYDEKIKYYLMEVK